MNCISTSVLYRVYVLYEVYQCTTTIQSVLGVGGRQKVAKHDRGEVESQAISDSMT